jgi:coenzyme F420 hydrogenase subunit beta
MEGRAMGRQPARGCAGDERTIASVARNGLCTGCGTCAGICPRDAVDMVIDHRRGVYVPRLDEEKCNECGLCFAVCPGHSVDFRQLNIDIFGKEPADILLGNYLNCYTGHAADYDIRYNSASGGLVTALLIFALEEGLIDGALVTRMREDRPLEPEPFIARTKEEIVSASKSKYCPVPANRALKEILKAKDGERFAVVGLPCHIHGMRKAEVVNRSLARKIVLRLGIFCVHTSSFLGTQFFLWRKGMRDEDVSKISYRGSGWPGGVAVLLKSGECRFVRYFEAMDPAWRLFCPRRCVLCCDQANELADLSFADAWLPEFADDKIGTSILIARTESGDNIRQDSVRGNKTALSEVQSNSISSGQAVLLKKRLSGAAIFLSRTLGNQVPVFSVRQFRPTWLDLVRAARLSLWRYPAMNPRLWTLVRAQLSAESLVVACLRRAGIA